MTAARPSQKSSFLRWGERFWKIYRTNLVEVDIFIFRKRVATNRHKLFFSLCRNYTNLVNTAEQGYLWTNRVSRQGIFLRLPGWEERLGCGSFFWWWLPSCAVVSCLNLIQKFFCDHRSFCASVQVFISFNNSLVKSYSKFCVASQVL